MHRGRDGRYCHRGALKNTSTGSSAYAGIGDFRSATAQQQLAVQKASGLHGNVHAMHERLDADRHGRAWRGDLLASS